MPLGIRASVAGLAVIVALGSFIAFRSVVQGSRRRRCDLGTQPAEFKSERDTSTAA
jgi:hypothetical protein